MDDSGFALCEGNHRLTQSKADPTVKLIPSLLPDNGPVSMSFSSPTQTRTCPNTATCTVRLGTIRFEPVCFHPPANAIHFLLVSLSGDEFPALMLY